MSQGDEIPASLIPHFHKVLKDLHTDQYPYVPCPGQLKKRASVALVLRVNPRYGNWPEDEALREAQQAVQEGGDTLTRLDRFFAQPWVQHGDPEVLFIKRASRKGDPWTGHVALPGGKRDPEDEDDRAAAVRETSEEVGIDLGPEHAIAIGNLPQRIVTTSWGKVPLMVLCPYIFLLHGHGTAPQRLQPTEIASTHWVPLPALINPGLRTSEYAEVHTRLKIQGNPLVRLGLRCLLGQQTFDAIRLAPSESLYCSSIPGFEPEVPASDGWSITSFFRSYAQHAQNRKGSPPLLLWGLTLGIVTDFLDMLPPHNAISIWSCPSFSAPDLHFVVWALSYRYNKQKHAELKGDIALSPASNDAPGASDGTTEEVVPKAGIEGLGSHMVNVGGRRRPNASATSILLDGYHRIVIRALVVTFVGRASVIGLLVAWWVRRRQQLSTM